MVSTSQKKRFASAERDAMKGVYLDPEFTDAEIEAELALVALNLKKIKIRNDCRSFFCDS